MGVLLRLVGRKDVEELRSFVCVEGDCWKLFGEEFDWKFVDEDDWNLFEWVDDECWRLFEGDMEEGRFLVPMYVEDWYLFEEEFGDCWKALVETGRLLVPLFEDWKLIEDPDNEWKWFDDDWWLLAPLIDWEMFEELWLFDEEEVWKLLEAMEDCWSWNSSLSQAPSVWGMVSSVLTGRWLPNVGKDNLLEEDELWMFTDDDDGRVMLA
jgi:hypothetical protein